jgi:hypothetical protein
VKGPRLEQVQDTGEGEAVAMLVGVQGVRNPAIDGCQGHSLGRRYRLTP